MKHFNTLVLVLFIRDSLIMWGKNMILKKCLVKHCNMTTSAWALLANSIIGPNSVDSALHHFAVALIIHG